jgi:hypothetical protein
MATKPGVAAKLMTPVSPAEIGRAKQRALDAYAEAYTPIHPVKTAAGIVLMCWYGRIDNAFLALAGAEGERRQVIQAAVDDLCVRGKAATDAAAQAESDYVALCLAGKVAVEALAVVACGCPGCMAASQRQRQGEAVAQLREALFALTLPDDAGGGPPRLLGLDEAKTAEAIRRLKETMQAVLDVSGGAIDWSEVYR